jgi:DNA-directed RNA polymerase subunit RPC12/RpoP
LIRHSKEEGDSLVMYCDNCTQKLEVPNELIGKEIECPVCHYKETVPA